MMEDFRDRVMQHQLTWLSGIVLKASVKTLLEYLSFQTRIGSNSVIIEIFGQTLFIQPNFEGIICYHDAHIISNIQILDGPDF